MIVNLRAHYLNALTSFAHVALLGVAAQADSKRGWVVCLALVALISFFAWIANFRRSRAIGDTPSSKVSSAAQGYVELVGRSQIPEDISIVSKLTALPCCWYRYLVERETDDNKWERVDSGESEDPFLLKDQTGQCLVDPDGAEVLTTRKETWTQGSHRYTEYLLLPQDKLYAIGEFATIGGDAAELDFHTDVKALLADWKRDHPKLLERFDLNQDKTLDLKEWGLARLEAKREIEKKHREIRSSPGVHILRQPKDRRLFLISNLDPDKLARKYTLWSAAHLVIFFVAGGIALFLA